ncbi:MAG: malto-oligosyltrehalose trehalohydrolase [Gemmatimonadales bacterium]|nr:MAG: malto-oligosyltrehalose trehalohydrolase [Gemmatimonadales bacterium]
MPTPHPSPGPPSGRRGVPIGATPDADGVHFRLWAPAAERVDLVVEDERGGNTRRPMEEEGGGWFGLHVPSLSSGVLYRFAPDGGEPIPDPASRFQPQGVHGPSQVVDSGRYPWRHNGWQGRPWPEAVFYELHVGAFTPEGTFRGVMERLDHLVDLGITALELMPLAAFPGIRGWGYDGVFPYAPHVGYGAPDELRRLVDEAHGRGLMVFLDVIYNHFGPEGNHLHRYAPDFFTDRFSTPWGEALDFRSRPVREFFIQNALYWLEEYRFDGLRLDAVHAIRDDSSPHFLEELADRVHRRFHGEREVHLVLENGRNEARYLDRRREGVGPRYVAQWNDDFHHAAHVLATGEGDGYYASFADDPLRHLGRALAEGFSFQGEPFPAWDGRPRGEPSGHLPPTAFVAFLQNHDQVGNRALGERLTRLVEPPVEEALLILLLLAPPPPLLFMGEEWGAPEPFLFFCDFHEELAERVREGRREEFSSFPAFQEAEARERIPDPNAPETFQRSVLAWDRAAEGTHLRRRERVRELLEVRRREIVPLLGRMDGDGVEMGRSARWARPGGRGLRVTWTLAEGVELTVVANLGHEPAPSPPRPLGGRRIAGTHPPGEDGGRDDILPPWSVTWFRS